MRFQAIASSIETCIARDTNCIDLGHASEVSLRHLGTAMPQCYMDMAEACKMDLFWVRSPTLAIRVDQSRVHSPACTMQVTAWNLFQG